MSRSGRRDPGSCTEECRASGDGHPTWRSDQSKQRKPVRGRGVWTAPGKVRLLPVDPQGRARRGEIRGELWEATHHDASSESGACSYYTVGFRKMRDRDLRASSRIGAPRPATGAREHRRRACEGSGDGRVGRGLARDRGAPLLRLLRMVVMLRELNGRATRASAAAVLARADEIAGDRGGPHG